MKNLIFVPVVASILLSGCNHDWRYNDRKLDKANYEYEVNNRITLIHSRTGNKLATIEGRCVSHSWNRSIEFTCKVGEDKYKRHKIDRGNGITFMSEELSRDTSEIYNYSFTDLTSK